MPELMIRRGRVLTPESIEDTVPYLESQTKVWVSKGLSYDLALRYQETATYTSLWFLSRSLHFSACYKLREITGSGESAESWHIQPLKAQAFLEALHPFIQKALASTKLKQKGRLRYYLTRRIEKAVNQLAKKGEVCFQL